ncbi:MAG: hypothetical protein HQ591_11170 [candidate division Zixibacteria bacterium]|nr:hypothetical protein [Candidatus Tariuqbacter arcticus]
MRNLFWIVVCIIILISFIIAIQPIPEEETESASEEAAVLIDSLQKAVDLMQLKFMTYSELLDAALVSPSNKQSEIFIDAADNRLKEALSIWVDWTQPVLNQLEAMNIPESSAKGVRELQERANSCFAPALVRNLLTAKLHLNIAVKPAEWNALIEQIAAERDNYTRNAAFAALAEALEPYDKTIMDNCLKRLDDPYFIYRFASQAQICKDIEAGTIQSHNNPQIEAEIMLNALLKDDCECLCRKLIELISNIDNPLHRAYLAARVIDKHPSLSADEFEGYLKYATEAGAILKAQCILSYLEKAEISSAERAEMLGRLTELASVIEEDYPREALLARTAVITAKTDMEAGLKMLDELQTETLREFALSRIARQNLTASDSVFSHIQSKLHDNACKAMTTLMRMQVVPMDEAVAIEVLTGVEGELEKVKVANPKLAFILAWAKLDPKTAQEKLIMLDNDADLIAALASIAEIWKDSDPQRIRMFLEDNFTEIIRSIQTEPLDKAPLLIKIADAMNHIDSERAVRMLYEAMEKLL